MMTTWLPLTEYSSKYHVSISTLRRRIKADSIKYQFNDGRYLIFDQSQEHRPSQASISEKMTLVPPMKKETASKPEAVSFETRTENTSEEPILTAANRLLSELKKAYTQILQEKEEQILHLKQEVSDLKTLVRVLESENDRLRR